MIIVTKAGVLLCEPGTVSSSSKAEIGEVHGVLRHLGEKCVFFGQWRGNLPCEGIYADTCDVDEYSSERDQLAMYRHNIAKLPPADAWLDMVGPTNSRFHLGKVDLLNMSVTKCSTVMGPMAELGLPRLSVITDLRCYPRECEMSEQYPSLVPRALMSQRDRRFSKVVGGKRYDVTEVRCDAHSWWYTGDRVCEKLNHFGFMSHCHLTEGYRLETRRAVYDALFTEGFDGVVIGDGWESYREGFGMRAVPTHLLFDWLGTFQYGLCVSPAAHNWAHSAKALMHASVGTIPFFYGRGEPHTYDPHYEIAPRDSEWRVSEPGELVAKLRSPPRAGAAHLARIKEVCAPTFAELDACLSDFNQSGRFGGFKLGER